MAVASGTSRSMNGSAISAAFRTLGVAAVKIEKFRYQGSYREQRPKKQQ
jgi:hypothetical protein